MKRILLAISVFICFCMISSIFLHDFSKAGPRKPIGEGRGWHFVGAAYLRSVFFLNLKPVEWVLITKEFEGTGEGVR
jgi:preprotein translocase subunit SecG